MLPYQVSNLQPGHFETQSLQRSVVLPASESQGPKPRIVTSRPVWLLEGVPVTDRSVSTIRAMSGQHPHSPHSQLSSGVFGPIALVDLPTAITTRVRGSKLRAIWRGASIGARPGMGSTAGHRADDHTVTAA